MPNKGKEAVVLRIKAEAGDAPVVSTSVPRKASGVAGSPVWHPRALAIDKGKRPSGKKSTTKNDREKAVSVTGKKKKRCATKKKRSSIEEAGEPITSTSKINIVRFLSTGEVSVPSLARSPHTPAQAVGAVRLLQRAGARLCRGSDGGLEATAGVRSKQRDKQDHKWRGWQGATEEEEDEEEETFAYQAVLLKWSSNASPKRGTESAEDKELGLSALPLSIDGAGRSSKDTHGTEGSAAATTSSNPDANIKSSSKTGPGHDNADHVSNFNAYVKETLRDSIEDEKLKRRKRVNTLQSAFAARDRANATKVARIQLDALKASREESIAPAAAELDKCQKAWFDNFDNMPRAAAIARAVAANLAEAQRALLAANNISESARRAQDATYLNFSHNSPTADLGSLQPGERNPDMVLLAAVKEAENVQGWVRSAQSAAVDASHLMDVEAVERFFLAHDVACATSAHKAALVQCEELDAQIRAARSEEKTARKEYRDAKMECIKPFQEHIAAQNRAERARETFDILTGRVDENFSNKGRPDTPKCDNEGGDSVVKEQAAEKKSAGTAAQEEGLEMEKGVDTTAAKNSAESAQESAEDAHDRAPKRRRHLGLFVS